MNNEKTQKQINRINYEKNIVIKEKRHERSIISFNENTIETWSLGLAIYLLSEKQYEIKSIIKNEKYFIKDNFQNMMLFRLSKEGISIEQMKTDILYVTKNRVLINSIALGNTMQNIINNYFIKGKTFTPNGHEIN